MDVALRVGELPDSTLIALRVGATRRAVFGSPNYLAARGTPRTPNDLLGHDCITYPGYFGLVPDVWTFVHGKTEIAVPVHSRLVVSSLEAACDAARAGIGLTVAFSHNVKEALETGTLEAVLEDFQPAEIPINLVYTPSRSLPIKLRAFLDFAAPRLRKRLTQ
jgi:DNA-binding transcriptional LysR family regulator